MHVAAHLAAALHGPSRLPHADCTASACCPCCGPHSWAPRITAGWLAACPPAAAWLSRAAMRAARAASLAASCCSSAATRASMAVSLASMAASRESSFMRSANVHHLHCGREGLQAENGALQPYASAVGWKGQGPTARHGSACNASTACPHAGSGMATQPGSPHKQPIGIPRQKKPSAHTADREKAGAPRSSQRESDREACADCLGAHLSNHALVCQRGGLDDQPLDQLQPGNKVQYAIVTPASGKGGAGPARLSNTVASAANGKPDGGLMEARHPATSSLSTLRRSMHAPMHAPHPNIPGQQRPHRRNLLPKHG